MRGGLDIQFGGKAKRNRLSGGSTPQKSTSFRSGFSDSFQQHAQKKLKTGASLHQDVFAGIANRFERDASAKSSQRNLAGQKLHGASASASAEAPVPGRRKKKRRSTEPAGQSQPQVKLHSSTAPLKGSNPASSQDAAVAVDAVHIEPISAFPLPDVDQRFVYVSPLRSPDPEPLLRLFGPPHSGAINICMLHDWSAGNGKFLGVASIEYPTAPALKNALRDILDARRPDGKVVIPGGDAKASSIVATIGHSCNTVRSMGAMMFKEQLQRGGRGNAVGELDGHSLQMLGACSKGVGSAALKEFAAIAGATKSAKTLRQIIRRLQSRAMVGRVPHTFQWRGNVTGLPLPDGPAQRMQEILDALDWKKMGNNRNPTGQGKINVENSFSLGMATYKLSEDGPFSTPFAFRPGLGVWDGKSVKSKHMDVWNAAIDMLRSVDQVFHCTSIGFNKNFKGSPHRDEKDSGPQVATALGDYTGGRLRVYTQTGAMDVDTKNRWCRFDGRYEHEVLPFTGTRYSVIFYQLEPSYAVDLTTTLEGTTNT